MQVELQRRNWMKNGIESWTTKKKLKEKWNWTLLIMKFYKSIKETIVHKLCNKKKKKKRDQSGLVILTSVKKSDMTNDVKTFIFKSFNYTLIMHNMIKSIVTFLFFFFFSAFLGFRHLQKFYLSKVRIVKGCVSVKVCKDQLGTMPQTYK